MSTPEGIAGDFKGTRAQFEAIFDDISDRNDGLLFKTLTRNLADDRQAYIGALHYANGEGWLGLFQRKAMAASLLETTGIEATGSLHQTVQQQALVNVNRGFFTTAEFNRGILLAERRVCKITVRADDADISKGTGFLVGPQTVLTAWHVVASLIDTNRQPEPGSEQQITIAFDVSLTGDRSDTSYEATEDWLVAGSPNPPDATPNEDGLSNDDFLDDRENLDFALIRLKGTPGRTRGYYTIKENLWPSETSPLIVCQHPQGLGQRITFSDSIEFTDDQHKTRITHMANTLKGSSGGLCLNSQFEPVALHQFALLDDNEDVVANGGVPTAHIAPFLQDARKVDPEYFKLSHLPGDGHPVIGRKEFQQAIWSVRRGEKRIIRVQGSSRSGKSFCVEILRATLNSGEDVFVEIAAAEIPVADRDLANMILRKVERPDIHQDLELPHRETSDTSASAWQEEDLWHAFSARLTDAIGNRVMWLVIDDLNHVSLPDTGVRSFLELIYKNVAAVPGLRVVLVGLQVNVPAAVIGNVYTEETLSFKRAEIAGYLGLCYGSHDFEANASELTRVSSIIQQGSGDQFNIPAVANFVREVVVPALKFEP